MNFKSFFFLSLAATTTLFISSCNPDPEPLDVPEEYVSSAYEANTATENQVMAALTEFTGALNSAEANAQTNQVESITYPTTLKSITNNGYSDLIDTWLVELVKAANSPSTFQTPDNGGPIADEEGGLLGSRLLDENGLELEQMIEKGSFGAACYNHALSIVNGDLSTAASTDRLIEIFGTDVSFNAEAATGAAKYAKRRSDNENSTGFFYNMKGNLITAKAAIEAGEAYNNERDEALNDFLLNWEKSNFATVINYCNGTKALLQEAASITDSTEKANKLGDAMHAYAEGVGFSHGFRGVSQKQITDEQIDQILELLLAPAGQTPTSYRFLNEASLLANLDQIIDLIQNIYGFTNEEVKSFYVNN